MKINKLFHGSLFLILLCVLYACGEVNLGGGKEGNSSSTASASSSSSQTDNNQENTSESFTLTEGRVKGQIYYSIEQVRNNSRPFELFNFYVQIIGNNLARGEFASSEGKFNFYDIPPGKYILYASTEVGGTIWVCDYTITVKTNEGIDIGILRPREYERNPARENVPSLDEDNPEPWIVPATEPDPETQEKERVNRMIKIQRDFKEATGREIWEPLPEEPIDTATDTTEEDTEEETEVVENNQGE